MAITSTGQPVAYSPSRADSCSRSQHRGVVEVPATATRPMSLSSDLLNLYWAKEERPIPTVSLSRMGQTGR